MLEFFNPGTYMTLAVPTSFTINILYLKLRQILVEYFKKSPYIIEIKIKEYFRTERLCTW